MSDGIGQASHADPPGPVQSILSRLSRLDFGRAILALALLELGLVLLVWSPFPAGVWHDDGVYLLLGQALAEGEGLRYVGIAGQYAAPKFPPAYPLVLGALWSLLPDLGAVTLWATVLNLVLLAAASLVFAWILHRRMGTLPVVAVGIAGLVWLSVPLWRVALVPFSEPFFILLLLLAMGAACGLEGGRERGAGAGVEREGGTGSSDEDESPVRWLLLVLLLLGAIHVRTVAVAVVVALAAALAFRKRMRAAIAVVASVVVGMLPWTLWSSSANDAIPEPLRDVLGSYGSWLIGQAAAFPAGYLAGLEGQGRDLVDRVATLLVPLPTGWEAALGGYRWVALIALVPAFFLGLDRIWERSRTVVLFVFAYLIIVWLWPFQAMRLLVPLLPFLVLIVAAGFWWRAGEAPGGDYGGSDALPGNPIPAWLIRSWRGVGIAWAVGFVAVSAWGLSAGSTGDGYRLRSGSLARSMEAVREATPADAVVGAPELWAAIPLHTGRTGAPSARFLPARPADAGPVWGTPSEQHAIWAVTGVDYLVLEQGGMIHGAALDRVTAACGPETARVRARWPEGILVELAWDEECRRRLGV